MSDPCWISPCTHLCFIPLIGLGVYSLGGYNVGVFSVAPRILDLTTHSSVGVDSLGNYNLGAYNLVPPKGSPLESKGSGYQLWIWQLTH